MLLCGVLRAAVSASFGALLQIVIFLLQATNISRVQASLPPGAEDEIILIEHLPGRRVHLQDFFWTGPEDAPPWVDPNQGLTFYETRTVHHTVTVYSTEKDKDVPQPLPSRRPGIYDPECTNCIEPTPRLDENEDENIGVLIGDDPGPRYWLLTVLRAGEAVPPKIELKLARLYRAAFSRQQQRHLGLLSTDPRSRRAIEKPELPDTKSLVSFSEGKAQEDRMTSTIAPKARIESKSQVQPILKQLKPIEIPKLRKALLPTSDINKASEDRIGYSNIEEFFHPRNLKFQKDDTLTMSLSHDTVTTINPMKSPEVIKSHPNKRYLETETLFNTSSTTNNHKNPSFGDSTSRTAITNDDDTESTSGKARSKLRSLDRSAQEIVQVRMQNMSVIEGGATRLIYSVHLGGKPVPAETAARDMALLSPQEVALELGAPVIIQSEPYLKETRPLALSRKRDAWLLIGAAGAGIILLALVLAGLILAAKRKRAHSAVAAPPNRSILKKEREYAPATPGLDNAAFSASETEAKTDGTSQRQTPGSLSRTPVTPETPESLDAGIHEVSTDNEEEPKRKRRGPWDIPERVPKRTRLQHSRITRTNAIDQPRTPDSMDTMVDHLEALESLENGYTRHEEATASPHSYLSMPSCKQFPSMRSVEPLSRVLEPVMVRHLDIDSPELVRHEINHTNDTVDDKFFARTSSATKDPGVVGPIVWNLRRQGLSTEGNGTSETDIEPAYMVPAGPVGRARRRLHELLEDSFSLFGSRDPKFKEPSTRPTSAARGPDSLAIFSETRGRSAHVSPVATPTTETKSRPRTSVPRRGFGDDITETGHSTPAQPRGAWGSRPLSAGPFHRPNLPEVDTRRILIEGQLPPEDPAIPLIASIKKELEKFSS